MKYQGLILLLLVTFCACKDKDKKEVEVSRTIGEVSILVDESFNNVVDDQISVFNSDYPDAHFNIIAGEESKIVPTFLNDSVRVMILSRMLTSKEEKIYANRGIPVRASRFAIDGIALISSKENPDSTITVEEVISILKGTGTGGKSLVFDNAYSSTVRYFQELAGINSLPKAGVYTLNSNDDVIEYIGLHKNYIGVVGVNWLLQGDAKGKEYMQQVKLLGVRNLKGKKDDRIFYKPTQNHLISGKYPFLRNIYIINGEGKQGLGTGFANWLVSQRGQLIVLKSGLGPHKLTSREFNLKN